MNDSMVTFIGLTLEDDQHLRRIANFRKYDLTNFNGILVSGMMAMNTTMIMDIE